MANPIYKNPLEQAKAQFNEGKISQGQLDDVAIAEFEKNKPLTPQTYDEFITQLGRHPSNDEYREWIKPRIADRVGEYKKQGLDEKSALAELDDEFGYDDLVREAYYGRPRRSDIQVWRDRAKKYADSVGDLWPGFVEHYTNLNDDDIQELIDVFGFNRKGEW